MMAFPVDRLLNENDCYAWLLDILHPGGLCCPRCGHHGPHYVIRSYREPILDYRCTACSRVFNAWTGTVFQGCHWRPSQIVMLLRGFAKGETALQLSQELGCCHQTVLFWRRLLQDQAYLALDPQTLHDMEVEVDEMYQNAGEKGIPHTDPNDPPRRRSNGRRGHGTFENDRPPVFGAAGRDSGEVHMEVGQDTTTQSCRDFVDQTTNEDTTVTTDEWVGYNQTATQGAGGRTHQTIRHSEQYARDDDGDGFCEVHINTMEGIWVGLRNFLRRFRGVSKHYLYQYVAMFVWAYRVKTVNMEFLRSMLGCWRYTITPAQ